MKKKLIEVALPRRSTGRPCAGEINSPRPSEYATPTAPTKLLLEQAKRPFDLLAMQVCCDQG